MPVTKLAPSLARKSTAAATSSGLTTLTRIPRPTNSAANDGGPHAQEWQCLLHGEENTFEVGVLNPVPVGLAHGLDGQEGSDTGIHEQAVDAPTVRGQACE